MSIKINRCEYQDCEILIVGNKCSVLTTKFLFLLNLDT
jgi:hypothetical protein